MKGLVRVKVNSARQKIQDLIDVYELEPKYAKSVYFEYTEDVYANREIAVKCFSEYIEVALRKQKKKNRKLK